MSESLCWIYVSGTPRLSTAGAETRRHHHRNADVWQPLNLEIYVSYESEFEVIWRLLREKGVDSSNPSRTGLTSPPDPKTANYGRLFAH